ncbi:GIY-YIG nuclease family protein [Pacificimonas sp. ICDLI1SI03]
MKRYTDTAKRCLVYFMQGEDGGPIKIGRARNPAKRLKAVQLGHPAPLKILATRYGGAAEERRLHRKYAESRMAGEWFAPTDALLREVRFTKDREVLERIVDRAEWARSVPIAWSDLDKVAARLSRRLERHPDLGRRLRDAGYRYSPKGAARLSSLPHQGETS